MKNEDIRWRIRELAARSRVTVSDLLREAGVGVATVWRWQHGLAQARPQTMMRIEAAAQRLMEKCKQ